jgi:hypothetical protein
VAQSTIGLQEKAKALFALMLRMPMKERQRFRMEVQDRLEDDAARVEQKATHLPDGAGAGEILASLSLRELVELVLAFAPNLPENIKVQACEKAVSLLSRENPDGSRSDYDAELAFTSCHTCIPSRGQSSFRTS